MKNRIAIKITLIYFFTSFIWILFSDQLIQVLGGSADGVTHLQTYKGLFFVCVTAALLFLVIRREIIKKNQIETDLIEAKEKAEESSRLKSAFLANVSHEIRTPLNGIMGFNELIMDDSFTGEDKLVFARHMAKNGNDLLKLINDIIDISKIQGNQLIIKKKNFDINLLLENLYNEFQKSELRSQRNRVDFKLIKGDDVAEFELYSDPARLIQILQTLLNNAFFFTNEGYVSFGYKKTDSCIEFFVEDSGCGIDDENKESIFEPFFKGKDYVIGNRGFGLGLAISKGLVSLLGGELKFDSIPNVGSHFYFKLDDEKLNNERKKKISKNEILNPKAINLDPSSIKMHQN